MFTTHNSWHEASYSPILVIFRISVPTTSTVQPQSSPHRLSQHPQYQLHPPTCYFPTPRTAFTYNLWGESPYSPILVSFQISVHTTPTLQHQLSTNQLFQHPQHHLYSPTCYSPTQHTSLTHNSWREAPYSPFLVISGFQYSQLHQYSTNHHQINFSNISTTSLNYYYAILQHSVQSDSTVARARPPSISISTQRDLRLQHRRLLDSCFWIFSTALYIIYRFIFILLSYFNLILLKQ